MRTSRRGLLVVMLVVAFLGTLLAPAAVEATPTEAPTGLSPAGGTVTANPEFTWDPVVGATHYRFQISTDPAFGSTILNQTTYNTTFIPVTELQGGTLHWRVAAIDGSGTGPYSETASITKSLVGPTLQAPADHAQLDYPQEPPTFQWSRVSSANSYLLEIDDAEDFINPIKVTTNNVTYTYDETQEIGQTFFWRVRGASTANGGGVLTEWSEVRDYQIRWDTVPVLAGPPNSTAQPITDVTLDWNPVLGAERYELQVNINDEFNGAHTVQTSNLLATTYRKATPFLNGSYFWRVRAIDPDGHVGPWSATWGFTRGWPSTSVCCGSGDDGIPDLLHPTAGGVMSDPPYFEWTPVERASHYEVQVAADGGFSGAASCSTIQTRVYEHSGGESTPGGCAAFGALVAGDIHFWRVRAIDGATGIVGLWSDSRSFLRLNDAPTVVGPTGGVHDTTPAVDWEPVAGAVQYRVAIYDGGTLIDTVDTYASSYTPRASMFLPPEEEGDPLVPRALSWGVSMIDVNGGGGMPGPDHDFVLDPPAGGASPDAISPLAGAPASVDMPALHWQPVTGATGYDVYADGELIESDVEHPSWTESSSAQWFLPGTYSWWVVARRPAPDGNVIGAAGSFQIASLDDNPNYQTPDFCGPLDDCDPLLTSPLLSWDAQFFADFNVYIAYDEFFTNIDRSYSTPWDRFVPREELPDNNVGQAYFWHLQACRVDGAICTPHPQGIETHQSAFRKLSEPVDLIGPGEVAVDPPPQPDPEYVTDQELDFEWEHYLPSNASALEAQRYRFQASAVPSFTSTLENVVTDNNAHTPTILTYPEGPIYWRVRAIDGSGNELTWSPTYTIIKRTPFPLDPDDESAILPTSGTELTGDPDFSWPAQPGASSYVLEIYRDADLNFSPANRVLNATTVSTAFTPLGALPAGEYAWRLRRDDAQGKDGPWTIGRTFTITEVGPSLNSPANGATLLDNNIVFRWMNDLTVASYRFQRSSTAAFTAITENTATVTNAFAPTVKYPDGTWYWRVLAINATGDTIGTSAVRSFTKVTLNAPGAPTGVSAVPGDSEATVSWTPPASDGGSPITSYRITGSPSGEIVVAAPATSALVTGLTNGVSYTFVVRATNSQGEGPPSPASVAVTPSTVPSAPTGVVGVAGNGQVTVNWTAPADDGGTPVFLSTVTASPGGATCPSIGTSCVVTGLTNGTDYTFTVVATNQAGNSPASAPSAPVTPIGMPSAPTGVSGVPGSGEVTVSWSAPASTGGSPITGYTVTASPGGATCSSVAPTLTCVVDGLNNGTAYTFRVVATNAAGDSPQSVASASVTPRTVPGAPTGVSGVPGSGEVTVSWSAPASTGGSPITGYTVTASPGGATCSSVAPNLTCVVGGLTNGTAYTFTVVATNAAGDSVPSTASASITPRAVPGAPTSVSGVAGNGQVTVSWSTPASTGGSPITGYTVTASPGGATCSSVAPTLTCVVGGLTNGTAYTFTVVATNVAGDSLPSAASAAVIPRTVPGAPTGVSGVAGNGQVTVSWSAPASTGGSPITGYTVTASPGGATCSSVAPTLSCVVAGLTNGTPYTFRVVATNAAGNSTQSAASNPVTPQSGVVSDCGLGRPGPFPDVDSLSPFCGDIEWLVAEGITGGFPDNTFRPTLAVSRGSMAAFLYRSDGSPAFTPPATPTFSDVGESHPFFAEIEWMVAEGVTGGFNDGTFRPSTAVSRGSMAAFLYRFADSPVFSAGSPSFSDVPGSHPFFDEIEWLVEEEITGGFNDGTYRPGSAVSRQGMAAFLHRFAEL